MYHGLTKLHNPKEHWGIQEQVVFQWTPRNKSRPQGEVPAGYFVASGPLGSFVWPSLVIGRLGLSPIGLNLKYTINTFSFTFIGTRWSRRFMHNGTKVELQARWLTNIVCMVVRSLFIIKTSSYIPKSVWAASEDLSELHPLNLSFTDHLSPVTSTAPYPRMFSNQKAWWYRLRTGLT